MHIEMYKVELRRVKAWGWHVQEWCVEGGTFVRLGLADTGFGPLQGRR
jgi:hypothetical protein